MNLKNIMRNNLIKKTSQIIFDAYLKLINENFNSTKREVLEILLVSRRPFWNGDFNTVTFKDCPAFTLLDNTQIGTFIILINIWESIIIDPKQINLQHVSMSELKEMVGNVVDITFEVTNNNQTNTNFDKNSIIEDYVNYSVDIVNRLGGVIL